MMTTNNDNDDESSLITINDDDDDAKFHWNSDDVLMTLWLLSLMTPPLAIYTVLTQEAILEEGG